MYKQEPNVQRTAAYALGNLQREQPAHLLIHLGAVPLLIPLLHSEVCFVLFTFKPVLKIRQNLDVVADAAWVFTFLAAGDVQHKQYLSKQGLLPEMVATDPFLACVSRFVFPLCCLVLLCRSDC